MQIFCVLLKGHPLQVVHLCNKKYLFCTTQSAGKNAVASNVCIFVMTAEHYFDDKKIKESCNCNDLTNKIWTKLKSFQTSLHSLLWGPVLTSE